MTEIPSIRKFMFDRSFSEGLDVEDKPLFTHEQLEAAKQEGYKTGYNEGKAAVQDDLQTKSNELVKKLEQKISALMKELSSRQQNQQDDIADISLMIASKILPDYVSKQGSDEVMALLSKVIHDMAHEPRFVIRISELQFETMNKMIKTMAENQAYTGQISIVGDPAMGPSDCKIEWADGGLERNVQDFLKEIDSAVARIKGLQEPLLGKPSEDENNPEASV
ncbi:MAG: FliH/SctL family protein [Alphaproteobacteria bacterium]|nr:FliH/SctL family protein [Alphaproteobacteria bacterium]